MARDGEALGSGVVAAFILGAIGGAAVALLLAPGSGRDTRARLRRAARAAGDRAAAAAGEGRDLMEELAADVMDVIDDVIPAREDA